MSADGLLRIVSSIDGDTKIEWFGDAGYLQRELTRRLPLKDNQRILIPFSQITPRRLLTPPL